MMTNATLFLRVSALIVGSFMFNSLFAQQWVEEMQRPNASLDDVRAAFNAEWANRPYEKGKGYKQFKRWEWFMESRVDADGKLPDPSALGRATKDMRSMEAAFSTKSSNWTALGPASIDPQSYNPGHGRVNVITEDPNDPNTIYVGTPSGGIWKTTNNAVSWTPLFDDMPTMAVSGIVVDPQNSNIIYVATGDGDGGDMYSMGVVKSTDGGQNWSTTGLNFNATASRRTHRLLMDPNDNSILYCAADNGLFRTTDAAATWTLLQNGNIRDVKLKPGNNSIIYASSDVFLRSLNNGASFDTIAQGLPASADVNRMLIGVSPAESDYVYALCGDEGDASFLGLWRSTDGGTTFSLRSSSPNLFGYSDQGSDSGGQSWYDMAIAVDPGNADDVFVAGINVWRSINGGNSWSIQSHWVYPSNIGYTHADVHFLSHDGNRIYCGSDGGIFRSENNGSTWTDLSEDLEITQFYRLGSSEGDPDLILAGAQDNGSNILYPSSGWTHVFGADGMEAMVDPSNSLIMFVSFQNGGVMRSFDNGQSFNNVGNNVGEDGAWVTPFMFDPNDPAIVYAGFQNLHVSYDYGDTWTNLSGLGTSTTVRSLDVSKTNSDVIYFGNRDGYIRRSTNGGSSFQVVDQTIPDLPRTYISIDPTDENKVYVTLGGFDDGEKVYMTSDGGVTWNNVSGNLPNAPVNCVEAIGGPDDAVYVGTDVGVFYKDNTLSGWQPFNSGLPNTIISELEVNYTAGKLRAATYGRGIWESPVYAPSSNPPSVAFTWSITNICEGDSIQFSDSSLDAAPGWTWSFPGGNPASSTLANPSVAYPMSGSYQVTLSMANGNGSNSYTDNINITIEPHVIYVDIVVDNYPGETTWNIIDDATQQVVASGGPYDGTPSGTLIADSVCIGDGCFTFEINDSYGDGMCCGFGQGSYSVSTMQLGTFATGGQFAASESTPFCLAGSTSIENSLSQNFQLLNSGNGLFTLIASTEDLFALNVLDAAGRVVQTEKPFSKQADLDLTQLSEGLYFLQLASESESSVVRIFR